jgi:putative transposase
VRCDRLFGNAAASRLTSDDVVRMFIDWISHYSEMHFQVISAVYNNDGISRGEAWRKIGRGAVREDSADADLYKLLFRDLSTGGITRQHRAVDYYGNFREKIRRRLPEIRLPAISTVHAVLDRNGLVNVYRPRHTYKAQGTSLSRPTHPNELWCADYKGEFMLADRRCCYPLTITDAASRYLICCEALSGTGAQLAFTTFERIFKEFGLPQAIRTDNGCPFANAHSLFGLSKLSVSWLRLGIALERTMPAHPEQNGSHERMHLTLRKEATRPASRNFLKQQERFDRFVHVFNQQRPHEALGMKYPAELYVSSSRPYRGLSDLEYPFHDHTITVTNCGRICLGRRKINLSTVLPDKTWV